MLAQEEKFFSVRSVPFRSAWRVVPSKRMCMGYAVARKSLLKTHFLGVQELADTIIFLSLVRVVAEEDIRSNKSIKRRILYEYIGEQKFGYNRQSF